MKDYFTILESIKGEIIVNKSSFIANIFRVENEDEAELFLNSIRKEHYKATHNCYAYVIGEGCEIKKASDDGEPQLTAGRPILTAIENNNLTNVLVIVTRYFGGIKLGASGLVRAYTQSAMSVINEVKIVKNELTDIVSVATDYSFFCRLKSFIESKNYDISDIVYANDVTLKIKVPIVETEDFLLKIVDMSNAQFSGEVIDRIYSEKLVERSK